MSDTSIQWTDKVWNCVRGCSRVSPGCDHCYAIRQAVRSDRPDGAYEGLTARRGGRLDWSGVARFIPAKLNEPLRWRKPAKIFVNSMSDLFHHSIDDADLDQIFAIMLICCLHETRGGHTFQVLTKRPKRMQAYLTDPATQGRVADAAGHLMERGDSWSDLIGFRKEKLSHPLIWLGVSAEDQKSADERIPLLLGTPAAVRWVSYEPALGAVDFTEPLILERWADGSYHAWSGVVQPSLQWIVVGGESGPGARPFEMAWARSTVAQCKAAGVACFVKQLGAVPIEPEEEWRNRVQTRLLNARNRKRVPEGFVPLKLNDKHGGDMAEWPYELRVREFPTLAVTA